MRENPVKAALKAGKTVVGVGIGLASNPIVARIMANAGFDFLFIDTEHNQINSTTLISLVQMARAVGISPLIRPMDIQYHLIATALDTGADGLIVPRVESREQAERLVSYCYFPPKGIRGCGSTAPLDYRREDWSVAIPWLNEHLLIVCQVESPQAIDNLDDILDVPGIDAVLVGPLDLSISLGVPGKVNDPKMVAAIDRVIAICRAHNMPSGIVGASPEALKPWWEKGMRFLSCGADSGMLLTTGMANVREIRAFAGGR